MQASSHRKTRWWLAALGVSVVTVVAIGFRSTLEQRPAAAGNAPPPAVSQPPVTDSGDPAETPGSREPRTAPEARTDHGGDFATAMRAALQRAEELDSQTELFELGYRWVAIDPEAALRFVRDLPSDHTLLLVALTDEWTRRDPTAAAAWATRLPEEEARRTRVLASLAAVWAESAPVDATRFAIALTPAAVQNEAIVSAVSGWSRQDPRATLEWADQLPSGKLREQIYTLAAFTWGREDPVAAAEWLRSKPDGRAWDAAASALCGALVERHPALALSLASGISDEAVRNQRLENAGRRWLAADRAAAETALIQSDLPTAFVARLLR